ncbi:MAG: SPASM domain-containing protein [Lachnospiraceae bacterium]|nr:SPASM domain-containing protein [Lachnospiraceae bacterium]
MGNIKTGITNYPVFERWCNTSLREECTECPFLPLCQGGCRAGDLG